MVHSFPTGSPSFYLRLYKIVDDPSLDPIISWGINSNNSFIVWNLDELRRRILPKSVEFGRNFSQFVSELCFHGFKRIGRFEFRHKDFVRGRPQILKGRMSAKDCNERKERFGAKTEAKIAKAKAKRATAKVAKVEFLLQHLQICVT